MAVLESMCPPEAERHLQLNRSRFLDFEDMHSELSTYLETRVGVKLKVESLGLKPRGEDDMDVGAFDKGKGKSKGKSKGKAKGGKGKGKITKGKGKPSGKHGKGTSSSGSSLSAVVCFNCGKTGHYQKGCRSAPNNSNNKGKGKGNKGSQGKSKHVNSVEETTHENEPEAETVYLELAMLHVDDSEAAVPRVGLPEATRNEARARYSDLSHDQFWQSVGMPTQDIQTLFQLTIDEGKDWDIDEADLKALGAHDITEIFSPPRMTESCKSYGLLPGYAIDLETGWDLTNKSHVKSLERIVDEEDPYLLTGSPPCEPFSPLQALNEGRVDPEVQKQRYDEGVEKLKTACGFYERQVKRGKYLLHEHPKTAKSWKEDCIVKVSKLKGVRIVEGPMCRWGMKSKDASGESYVKKPTRWMTNSPELAKILEGTCANDHPNIAKWHRHVHLVNGRAKMARIG